MILQHFNSYKSSKASLIQQLGIQSEKVFDNEERDPYFSPAPKEEKEIRSFKIYEDLR